MGNRGTCQPVYQDNPVGPVNPDARSGIGLAGGQPCARQPSACARAGLGICACAFRAGAGADRQRDFQILLGSRTALHGDRVWWRGPIYPPMADHRSMRAQLFLRVGRGCRLDGDGDIGFTREM